LLPPLRNVLPPPPPSPPPPHCTTATLLSFTLPPPLPPLPPCPPTTPPPPLLHSSPTLRSSDLGIKLALSSASRSARSVLQSTLLEDYFDAIIDGHSTRKSKPDPECFLLAAKALGIEPADCLVFED